MEFASIKLNDRSVDCRDQRKNKFNFMKLNSNEAPEFVNVKIRSVQKHILVVDDDGFMLSMYASRSRRAGYAIETDRDGEQGWQSLSTINDALLLTDNDMPRPTVIEMTDTASHHCHGFARTV
jgi:PleD family two-component response regulator